MAGQERVMGFARVPQGDVTKLLASSGSGFFVDPLRSTTCPNWSIAWQDPEKDEEDSAFLARMRRSTPALGVAAGFRTLGLRQERPAGTAVPKTWVFEQAPLNWSQDEVAAALAEQFTDISFLSRRKRHGACDFVFRGTAAKDASVDVIAIPVSDEKGCLSTYWTRWAPPRSNDRKAHAFKPVLSVDLRKSDGPTTAERVEVPVPPAPRDADAAGNEDAKKPESVAKAAKVLVRACPKSMQIEAVPPDGACLFHAWSKGLSLLEDPVVAHARELRATAVAHMEKHAAHYSTEWDGKGPDGDQLPNFAAYLTSMQDAKAWGGNLEIQVLKSVVPRTLNVPPTLFHGCGKRGKIHLWFTGNHFDLLTGTLEEIPQPFTSAVEAMRGGGPSVTSEHSCQTVWTPAASANTAWTRQGSARPLGCSSTLSDHASASAVASALLPPDSQLREIFDESGEVLSPAPQLAKTYAYKDEFINGMFRWACPFCAVSIVKPNRKTLSCCRHDHLRRFHSDQRQAQSFP
eukprot:s2909_g5.t1